MSEYYKKYLKYKNKYINLQKQIGSGKKTAIGKFTGLDKNAPYHPALQTSSDSVDSLVVRAQLAYAAQNSKHGDDITLPQVPPVPYVPEPIEQSDIMYQDELVCILRPDVKKGIIVFTNFKQPTGTDSLCNLGLKTGKQLQKEGIDFDRSKIHPYIFFRAPYYSRNIDYTSVETEINSSYGEGQIGIKSRAFIRVDPDNTFVFSSEIRAKILGRYFNFLSDGRLITKQQASRTHTKFLIPYNDERYKELYNTYYNFEINKSKKTLSEYLIIIKENELISGKIYNLYSSRKELSISSIYPPFDSTPIERNSEILVSIPHLKPEYFVICTP
jgi:hypothetical protein